jgi:hypothetical protein
MFKRQLLFKLNKIQWIAISEFLATKQRLSHFVTEMCSLAMKKNSLSAQLNS